MTTLSKEDVVRMAISYHIIEGPNYEFLNKNLMSFVTEARADLVAENERLKATPPDQRQDLHCVVSDIAAECRELREQLTATRTALAAAEADNERLREALSMHIHLVESNAPQLSGKAHGFAKEALAKPRDDSALREMIAGVYEECKQVCDDKFESRKMTDHIREASTARSLAEAISALAEKAKGE